MKATFWAMARVARKRGVQGHHVVVVCPLGGIVQAFLLSSVEHSSSLVFVCLVFVGGSGAKQKLLLV
eukprot:2685950-Amphidinium_carterae.1